MSAEVYIQQGWKQFVESDWYSRLDDAQTYAYRKAMKHLRKQPDSSYRAAEAIKILKELVLGDKRGRFGYCDGHFAVAYLLQYQLNHCVMACCVWWDFSNGAAFRVRSWPVILPPVA